MTGFQNPLGLVKQGRNENQGPPKLWMQPATLGWLSVVAPLGLIILALGLIIEIKRQ